MFLSQVKPTIGCLPTSPFRVSRRAWGRCWRPARPGGGGGGMSAWGRCWRPARHDTRLSAGGGGSVRVGVRVRACRGACIGVYLRARMCGRACACAHVRARMCVRVDHWRNGYTELEELFGSVSPVRPACGCVHRRTAASKGGRERAPSTGAQCASCTPLFRV